MAKKLLAFFLALTCIAMPVSADNSSFDTMVYNDDFESYTVGVSGNGEAGLTNFGGTLLSDNANKYLSLWGLEVDSNGTGQMAEKYFINKIAPSDYDETVIISADFCLNDTSEARMYLMDGTISNAQRSLRVRLGNKNIYLTYHDGTTQTQSIVGEYEIGQWFNITAELNFNTRRIENFYINGKSSLTDGVLYYFFDIKAESANNISFEKREGDEPVYIDNVSVEYNRYPELYEKIIMARALYSNQKGDVAGEYPASAFTVLKDVVDKARTVAATTVLSREEQEKLEKEIDNAVKRFNDSVIQSEASALYKIDFENKNDGDTFAGNSGTSATVVADGDNKVGKVTSRYLNSTALSLPEKFAVSIKFKVSLQRGTSRVFHMSNSSGSECIFNIDAEGSNLVRWTSMDGTEKEPFLENYEVDEWYVLKVVVDQKAKQYTLYYAKEGNELTEVGTYVFCSNPSSIGRILDIRPRTEVEIHFDDFVIAKIDDNIVENAANSVKISGKNLLKYEESETFVAEVFDKKGQLWEEQNITWSVVEGGAEITDNGTLAVDNSYAGNVKIKAEYSSDVYEYINVMYLPQAVIDNVKAEIDKDKLIISGSYQVAKYIPRVLSMSVTGSNGMIELKTDELNVKTDSTFTHTFKIPIDTLTQILIIRIEDTDTDLSTSEECRVKYYGTDVDTALIKELNDEIKNSGDATKIIEEYRIVSALNLNFAYDICKSEYNEKILKEESFADKAELQSILNELNLLYGVKKSLRENIVDVITEGKTILKNSGLNPSFESLSVAEKESVYLELIGFNATDINSIVAKINSKIAEISESSSTKEPASSGSIGGGGGGGGKKFETKPVKTEEASAPETEIKDVFSDINQATWAKDAILKLNEMGIMIGNNGKVYPNNPVTRAEFAKLLVNTFNIAGEDNAVSFSDFDSSAWWSDSVKRISSAKIITGYEDNTFRPNAPITREEAAVMVRRCIDYAKIDVYNKTLESTFADEEMFSDFAAQAIKDLKRYGIVSGKSDNTFASKDVVIRAEAAVMIVNVLSFTEKG